MKKVFLFSAFLSLIFLFSGCSPKIPEHYIGFYLESSNRGNAFDVQKTYFLPVIDKEIKVGRNPVLDIDALSDCIVTDKFDPVIEEEICGLFFRIKDEFTIRLRQIAANAAGRKILLVADGKPLGFCLLKKDFTRNDLFFYIMSSAVDEEKKEQLEELCFELNGYILEYREYKEKR